MILNHKLGRRLLSTLKVDTVHQGHVEFLHLCAGRSRVLVFTPGVGGGGLGDSAYERIGDARRLA